jgi:hypothetical protein
MNWLHFSIWVAGLYLLYYLVVILLDVAASKRVPAANAGSGELTFSETVQPKQLQHEPDEGVLPGAVPKTADRPRSGITATGGVSLRDFFNLAKQESIIYTRPVSFV